MAQATTAQQVYNVVSKNGAIPFNRRPSEAQLRYYSSLVIEVGARFEAPDPSWSGRTKWQMAQMIETLVARKN